MVFQRFNLFEKKTALENVMEGLIVVKKMSKAQAREIAIEQLKLVGMAPWANIYPSICRADSSRELRWQEPLQ